MLVGILICCVLITLFTMACAGHLAKIEQYQKMQVETKIAELKLFTDGK